MSTHSISGVSQAGGEGVISRAGLWGGRVLSGIAVVFFVVDGGMKLGKPAVVLEAMRQLGYPESSAVGIGVLLLACTLLYVNRRTSILGVATNRNEHEKRCGKDESHGELLSS